MRAVVQRVLRSSILINGKLHSKVGSGMLILIGIEQEDTREDALWLANKISELRIFSDQQGLMNLSVIDASAEALVVSQFTLHASTKKGNRPSFIKAAKPQIAEPLYEFFAQELISKGIQVETGVFGADMQIDLVNDGPVTIIIDTKNKE